jgi:GNAT superfamily N-acetyltransferase
MDIDGMKVRSATAADSLQISALCDQLGYPASSEQVAQRIKAIQHQDDHTLLIAQGPDSNLLGWVHIFLRPLVVAELEAELGGLIVDDRYRGQGIGKLLMRHAELWSSEKGCQALRLRSNIIRKNAHAFYERIGYEKIKTSWVFRKALESPTANNMHKPSAK